MSAILVIPEYLVEPLLGAEIMDEADRFAGMQAVARKQWNRRAKLVGLEVAAEERNEA